jgi:tRNA/tmRNA/rRNA uracil-C5-methylase (TrmA/RlmC/RlmD family)
MSSVSSKTPKAQTLTLTLEKMVHGGKTLARREVGKGAGQVVLVWGGLPGEQVRALVSQVSGVLQGEVVEVIQAHPDRIPASLHPGLDYSFIPYDLQLTLKRQVVMDTLERSQRSVGAVVTGLEQIPKVMPAAQQWHYRHGVQPAYVAGQGLGYRSTSSHDVQVLTHDPVAHESINRVWKLFDDLPKGVREVVFRCNAEGEVLACLVASGSSKHYLAAAHELVRRGLAGVSYAAYDARGRFRKGSERLAGKRYLMEQYGAFGTRVTPGSFAQPNPSAASKLYQDLVELAQTKTARGLRVLDLFAGSGIIGLHLAQYASEVVAVDIDRANIEQGKREARAAGVDNIKLLQQDVRTNPLPPAELICVNPPRSGLAKPVRERIAKSPAKQLCYVSCDVATWSRDAVALAAAGFELNHVQPYDFYPHTHHIELLSWFARR